MILSTTGAVIVPVIVASVGAFAAFLVYLGQQLASRRDAKRALFSQALADVYRWAELPYRVARRRPGEEAKHAIAAGMSDLQETLYLHRSWLRIESSDVHRAYERLVEATKLRTAEHLRCAWEAPSPETGGDMNVGDLKIDIQEEVEGYVAAVRDHFAWWREALGVATFGFFR